MPVVKSENRTDVEINRNFVINVLCECCDTDKIVSARRYRKILGDNFAYKHFEKALNSLEDITTIKLRRGLTVKFRSK